MGPRGTLRIAWDAEPESLSPKLSPGTSILQYHWIFSSSLTYLDLNGIAHPLAARTIPSLEGGDWVINPDGTMVTTYRLRENARWHDGVPLTAADYAFAFQVYSDPDIPIRERAPEAFMARVEAPDDHTVVIRWKESYNRANVLGRAALDPLPRHLVEGKFRTNKTTFHIGEEWTTAFVGMGPYRLDRWTAGAGFVARANRDWFLGPPKIEVLDIRFIPDAQTLLANLLAGEVDFISSPSVHIAEAAIARDQWVARGSGYLKVWVPRLRFMEFQSREVAGWQRAVTDLRVRKALLHAIDRPSLTEVMTFDLAPTADVFLPPSDALFPEVDRAISKYPYDPSRAGALLAEAGWRRSSPHAPLADATGQVLDVSLWSQSLAGYAEEAAIITDDWKQAGINSSFFMIPAARGRDNEFGTSFPGMRASARTIGPMHFIFISDNLPTPENRWQGANRGSFSDAEVDRLQSIVVTTFDPQQQRQATVALHKRMSEVLGILPLYYGPEVLLARKNLTGPVGEAGAQQGVTWNIFEWALTE